MAPLKKANISTVLSITVKDALMLFCKKRGLKMSHFIEEAIQEHLEDEMDLEAFETRRTEKRIPLAEVLKHFLKSVGG
ncbi:MAG: hypothetical protein HYY62_04250 [Deltaproteobacteria bacterium]|nr:hypothetical protein [Deltaproteobacteria bacterium]